MQRECVELINSSEMLSQIQSGQVLLINSRQRNGLILGKRFHAEFAGPGAVVGGVFDLDCQWIVPVGNLSLLHPASHEERQKAYLIRRQWLKLTKQLTDDPSSLQRAQMLLNQFENYFDVETVKHLPATALAQLVGVLPQTIVLARSLADSANRKA
jgi:hypothetical protein